MLKPVLRRDMRGRRSEKIKHGNDVLLWDSGVIKRVLTLLLLLICISSTVTVIRKFPSLTLIIIYCNFKLGRNREVILQNQI